MPQEAEGECHQSRWPYPAAFATPSRRGVRGVRADVSIMQANVGLLDSDTTHRQPIGSCHKLKQPLAALIYVRGLTHSLGTQNLADAKVV